MECKDCKIEMDETNSMFESGSIQTIEECPKCGLEANLIYNLDDPDHVFWSDE